MTRPLRIEYEGAFYHVTARGNERKKIFFTPRDYEKFREILGIQSYSSAAKVYQRFVKELESDPTLNREVQALEQALSLVQACPPCCPPEEKPNQLGFKIS